MIPTVGQRRASRISIVLNGVVLLVLLLLVGELYQSRVAARDQVRHLACFAIQYTPDRDDTIRGLRAYYHCPPAIPAPVHKPLSKPTPTARPTTSATGDGAPGGTQGRSAPARAATPTPGVGTHTAGVGSAPASRTPANSVSPSASPTATPILSGIVCSLATFPLC